MNVRITFLLALAGWCAALPALAVEEATAQPWRVLLFHPFRPGVLSQCEYAHRGPHFERVAPPDATDPLKSRWLVEAVVIDWQGGRLVQPASGEVPAPPRLLSDVCFTLVVAGQPVLSGAVVRPYSARRFEFPALVVESDSADAPLQLMLTPQFPATPGLPAPAGWRALLNGLAGAEPAR